jgi:hypothetical protein
VPHAHKSRETRRDRLILYISNKRQDVTENKENKGVGCVYGKNRAGCAGDETLSPAMVRRKNKQRLVGRTASNANK